MGAVDGRFSGSASVAYMLEPHEVVQASLQRLTRRQKRQARLREVLAGQVLTGIALRVGGEPEREVVMCAGEALEEEVRVLLGPGRREAVAHLV
jgi:hypothetical protein